MKNTALVQLPSNPGVFKASSGDVLLNVVSPYLIFHIRASHPSGMATTVSRDALSTVKQQLLLLALSALHNRRLRTGAVY